MFMIGPKGRTSVGARREEPKKPHTTARRSTKGLLCPWRSCIWLPPSWGFTWFFFNDATTIFWTTKVPPLPQKSKMSNATDVFSMSKVKCTQMLLSISSPSWNVLFPPLLQEEDYPGAIQLCLECQKAASTFKHYSCIRYDMKCDIITSWCILQFLKKMTYFTNQFSSESHLSCANPPPHTVKACGAFRYNSEIRFSQLTT